MANISDYLKWRGDIDFTVDPFNEVDNLILAQLAYTEFDDIVPGPEVREWITIQDVYERFFAKYTREEIMSRASSTKVAPFLMDDMVGSKRFGNLKLSGYVNEIDEESQSQFSAVTYMLGDGTLYVAYRGTDNTIVGWKEDFNMSFLYQTAGQQSAARYLDDNFRRTLRKLRVGGHSKGGNFAVYASTFCVPAVQNKIMQIYSNDGPGFQKIVTDAPEYHRILGRVQSIIPEYSIVGMLLENQMEHKVVKSSQTGAYQHDAMSWEVLHHNFVCAPSLSENSLLLDIALKSWLIDLDNDVREEFVDILFEVIASTGATTVDEITTSKWKAMSDMMKAMNGMPPEKQTAFREVVKKLVQSGSGIWMQSMKEKLIVKESIPFIEKRPVK